MNMHGHSNRNVIFICTTDQGYGDVNAGEHNHQRFGPVPEQFLYNPGEDILLSTGAVTVLRTGGYLIIDDLEKHFSKEIVHMILELYDT